MSVNYDYIIITFHLTILCKQNLSYDIESSCVNYVFFNVYLFFSEYKNVLEINKQNKDLIVFQASCYDGIGYKI